MIREYRCLNLRLTTVGGGFLGNPPQHESYQILRGRNALGITLVVPAKAGTQSVSPGQARGRLGIYLLASSSALEKLPNHSSRYPSSSSA